MRGPVFALTVAAAVLGHVTAAAVSERAVVVLTHFAAIATLARVDIAELKDLVRRVQTVAGDACGKKGHESFGRVETVARVVELAVHVRPGQLGVGNIYRDRLEVNHDIGRLCGDRDHAVQGFHTRKTIVKAHGAQSRQSLDYNVRGVMSGIVFGHVAEHVHDDCVTGFRSQILEERGHVRDAGPVRPRPVVARNARGNHIPYLG